jgi:pimeloyl-ACP methyl ester carboxylesterase
VQPKQPSDPPTRRAYLHGRAITWVETGPSDGPCIVMVHGLPGSHRDFRWLAPPLEAWGFRVIRLDMPGFGGSDTGPAQLSALAHHVLGRLDHLQLDRVVLLGHSFGGPQALLAASRDPQRVRGLVLLASVGMRPHQGLRRVPAVGALNRGLSLPVIRRPLMRAVSSAFRRAGFPASTSEHEIRRSLEIVGNVDFELIRAGVRALKVPTLLAYCSDDPQVEPAIGDQLGHACPAGPRLRFDRGGHNLQKVLACEIAAELAPWAQRLLTQLALPPA